MKILGLDTSTSATGFAILNEKKIIESGVIKPSKKDDAIKRIIYIEKEIMRLSDKYRPQIIVIEEMVTFRNANSLRVLIALIYHLVIEFTKKGIKVCLVRPSVWRKTCGIKGRVRSEYKINAIKYIKEKYNKEVSDDEADAICIAEFGKNLEVEHGI